MLINGLRKENYASDQVYYQTERNLEYLIIYAVRHYDEYVLALLRHKNDVFEAISVFTQNILNVPDEQWKRLRLSKQVVKGYNTILQDDEQKEQEKQKSKLLAYMKLDNSIKIKDCVRVLVEIYQKKPLESIKNIKLRLNDV